MFKTDLTFFMTFLGSINNFRLFFVLQSFKFKMEQNDDRSFTFTSIPKTSSEFTLILDNYVTSQTPSVVVLETINEGIVKVKVEADVMAYILYCLYSTFSSLQQVCHFIKKTESFCLIKKLRSLYSVVLMFIF